MFSRRLLPLAPLVLTLGANAQLVVGHQQFDGRGEPGVWLIDLTQPSDPTYQAIDAWTGIGVKGLAADDAQGVLYAATAGKVFYRWDYGSSNTATFVGGFVESSTGNTLSVSGLTVVNGQLYGVAFQSPNYNIYSIDPLTGVLTQFAKIPNTMQWLVSSLAYEASTGLFYISNESNGGTRGIHSFDAFGSGTTSFVTPFPPGKLTMPGLTSHAGSLYVISEDIGDHVYRYDLTTGQYSTLLTSPNVKIGSEAGGTWAPGLTLNSPRVYCSPKLNSGGCKAILSTAGVPSMTHPGGFDVKAFQVVADKPAVFFYGFASASIPFQGGTLCVQPPLQRTAVQDSGSAGASSCPGRLNFDFNAHAQSGVDPGVLAGSAIFGQFWYRDPALILNPTALSNAVTWVMAP